MEVGKFYEQYTIEDYILDERFHSWVMQGSDSEFWQAVLREDPGKAEIIDSAKEFILNLKIREDIPDKGREQAALLRLRELTARENRAKEMSMPAAGSEQWPRWKWIGRLAASLVILGLLGSGVWMLLKKRPIRVETGYGQMKEVKLPDNSVIYLNANSNLRYEKSYLGKFPREVWLEGEAFFQVSKQENDSGGYRNFVVHTRGMAVEVLGTTFNVRDRDQVSSVTLQTGKVQVNTDRGHKVTLRPGERLEIDREEKQVRKDKVMPERYTSWRNLRYTFDKTPVRELVQIIHDNYGLEVKITDTTIARSELSGVLEAETLQTFVNALSFALNITIKKEGNQLIFEPKQK